MKTLTILGIFALFLLLVIPGAVSAADVTVSGSILAPADLTVTAISPNVGAGAYFFANEPNVISVTVKNNGGLDAAAPTVEVVVGTDTYTAAVPIIAGGGSQTVTVTDTVSRTYASGHVSVTATADSAGVIAESDETNNAMTAALDIYYNGYKGKRWTDGNDMTTQATFNGRYDVIYSAGDSAYASRGWTTKTVTWSSADLPIPAGATVTSARLYQGISSNNNPGTYPNPNPGMSFNGVTKTPIADYKDTKGFETYNYPYGLLVYDVTDQFNTAGNTLVMTAEAPSYAIYGAYLIVVYEDPATTEKKIWINDEADILYATGASSVSSVEATAYAPFTGIDTTGVSSAQAIAIVGSGNTPSRSKFFFNSQEFTGFGPRLASPQIGFYIYDVKDALSSGNNEAQLQSYDALAGTVGDYLLAMNTILVVEKTEDAPDIDFNADNTAPAVGQTVTFTATNTGGLVNSWAWTIEGTEDTDYEYTDGTTSASQNPKVKFLVEGGYDVSLTATGPGGSDTESKDDYIQVGEGVIEVTVNPTSIDFGTMQAGVDEAGYTAVTVTTTYGTAWSVDVSASNSGKMTTGSADLENPFELANGGGAFHAMSTDFTGFMTGTPDEDRTDTANVKQAIAATDAPGSYTITLTFLGGFV